MGPIYNNLDCRNYAPVDVAKGICQVRKQLVLADGEACEMFEKLPKCRHCAKYTPGQEEYLGTCAASANRPMTYPDLISVTCEWFSWKEACREV
jgi:4-hydroxyphenylacetate decarboxylase small subunit